jgi:hypothetical protein
LSYWQNPFPAFHFHFAIFISETAQPPPGAERRFGAPATTIFFICLLPVDEFESFIAQLLEIRLVSKRVLAIELHSKFGNLIRKKALILQYANLLGRDNTVAQL